MSPPSGAGSTGSAGSEASSGGTNDPTATTGPEVDTSTGSVGTESTGGANVCEGVVDAELIPGSRGARPERGQAPTPDPRRPTRSTTGLDVSGADVTRRRPPSPRARDPAILPRRGV